MTGWAWLGLAVLGFLALGLLAAWRTSAAQVREHHHAAKGGMHQLGFMSWPKACIYCGTRFHSWWEVGRHQDAEWSACAAYIMHIMAAETGNKAPTEYDWKAYIETTGQTVEMARDDA